jgi:hypothetical protein
VRSTRCGAGDVDENSLPPPREHATGAGLSKADLRGVRVAATRDRLCVEWETAAPIEPEYGFSAWVVGRTHPDQAFGDDLNPVAGRPSYP